MKLGEENKSPGTETEVIIISNEQTVKEVCNRIVAGEKVECFIEEVGDILHELFVTSTSFHVEVYASEPVTWIQRK